VKAIDLLKEFIAKHKDGGGKRCINQWLQGDDMDVYVRRSVYRPILCELLVCLDIANVEVHEKSQGNFTNFLREAHAINPWGATYVESVHEERLHEFLLKEGFSLQLMSLPASYYKLTGVSHESDQCNQALQDR
jgi:hypothetical protein